MKNLSSTISPYGHEIPRDEYCILPLTGMGKRETIGKVLNKARLELGMSVPQLQEKILQDHRAEIGQTTIRDLEKDKTPNPGVKTIEFVALGVGLDPMEVMALALDDPPEQDSGFTETQFGQLHRLYKKVEKDERPFIDEMIKMLREQMEKRR